jgi:hypothetical protein
MRIVSAIFLALVFSYALLVLGTVHEARGIASELILAPPACAAAGSFGLVIEPQQNQSCIVKAYYFSRNGSRAILDQGRIVEVPQTQVLAVRESDFVAPLSDKQQLTQRIAYTVLGASLLGLLAIGFSLWRALKTKS